jgi:ribosome-associated translation inhibitor RaiA
MKIQVRFHCLQPSDALRDHATRRINSHLSRFGEEVRSVLLRIRDVNGPKGGPDKQCQVTVRGRRFASVVIEDLSEDAYAAVDVAIERAGRAVGRDLERARSARAPLVARGG